MATVLVVDDIEGNTRLLELLLTPDGHTVRATCDGAEALRLVHAEPPDLILMDVMMPYVATVTNEPSFLRMHLMVTDVVMPGMSGRTLVEQSDRTRPGMKVLHMSGYTGDTMTRHGMLGAPVPFLGKPFTAADLLRKVREVLNA